VACSTPDKPVHCVVWAKELHKLLLGDSAQSMLFEGGGEEGGGMSASESVYMHLVQPPSEEDCRSPERVRAWAEGVFRGVFELEIVKRLSIGESYKTAKHPPEPLKLATCLESSEQRLRDSAAGFLSALCEVMGNGERRPLVGSLEFDKDDPLSMKLVACATNLRAATFGIEMLSEFEIQSIAGNIVPAVATTNAVVAGLETLEMLKLLTVDAKGSPAADVSGLSLATVCMTGHTSNTMVGSFPGSPNPLCADCSRHMCMVRLDVTKTALGEFLQTVAKDTLHFEEPSILFRSTSSEGEVSHFSFFEEDDDPKWLTTVLSDLPAGGVQHGTIVTLDAMDMDGIRVDVLVMHADASGVEVMGSFDARTAVPRAAPPQPAAPLPLTATEDDVVDLDPEEDELGGEESDLVELDTDDDAGDAGGMSSEGSSSRKRERSDSEEEDGNKRVCLDTES
jgi:ubiquitin-like 1-activating enzyme E1 B